MPSSKPPAPRSNPSTLREKPTEPGPKPAEPHKPSVEGPPQRESLEAFAELAMNSLEALTKDRGDERATRDAEREEVARALRVALKSAPELKSQLDRVSAALDEARQRDVEEEERMAKLVKAGLTELAELSGRHLRGVPRPSR